jgi:hypothetical protein
MLMLVPVLVKEGEGRARRRGMYILEDMIEVRIDGWMDGWTRGELWCGRDGGRNRCGKGKEEIG